jgi:Predicted integral membrane protein
VDSDQKNDSASTSHCVRDILFSVHPLFIFSGPYPGFEYVPASLVQLYPKYGFLNAFSRKFYDYNPPYVYLIGLVTYLPQIPKLTAIKLISVIFDFVAASAGYQIAIYFKRDPQWGWLTFFSILLTPIVFIESGFWGQCDIIYTAFLLWMAYALLHEKFRLALFFFSLAFIFKLQTLFLSPILLLLLLKRKLRILDLWIPLSLYLISMVPALIAGCPPLELLMTYFAQFSAYHSLSMNAPSIFYLLSDGKYYSLTWVIVGLVLACAFVAFFIYLRLKIPAQPAPSIVFADVCFLGFFIPFLLPEMHERYFFPAALFFILVALLMDKKAIWLATLVQISSVISYIHFLYQTQFDLTLVAMYMNLGLAVWIFIWYWRGIHGKAAFPSPGPAISQLTD